MLDNSIILEKLFSFPSFKNRKNKNISIIPFGATSNYIYFIKAEEEEFVLRLKRTPRPNDLTLFVPSNELQNVFRQQPLGIGVIYDDFNNSSGDCLMRKIKHIKKFKTSEMNNTSALEQSIMAIKSLHSLDDGFVNNIDMPTIIKSLYLFLERENSFFELKNSLESFWGKIKKVSEAINKLTHTKVACHNDLSLYNILLTDAGIRFVDWERSGNNDPAWELAYFSVSASLDDEKDRHLLAVYDPEENDSSLKQRFILYKPLVDFWKALWLLYQINTENKQFTFEGLMHKAKNNFLTCENRVQSPLFNKYFKIQT